MSPLLPDPGVEIGPWRVLPRADGKWILYDERRPLGQRTAAVGDSLEDVSMQARVALQTAANVARAAAERDAAKRVA